jgi:SpoVK/Ycf46/Vps4 family AAA+-type ATPase
MSTSLTEAVQFPGWVKELLDKYQAGIAHVFLLAGNVSDYVVPGVGLRKFLTRLFSRREVIVFYDRSAGLTFPLESMKQRFAELCGLAPVGGDEVLEALRAAGGVAPGEPAFPRDPLGALALVEKVLRNPDVSSVAVIEYLEALAPQGEWSMLSPEDRGVVVALQRWARDPAMMAAGNIVILVTAEPGAVHPALRAASSRIEMVRVPAPGYEERLAFVRWLGQKEDPVPLEVSPEEFAAQTAGLSLVHIEDIELRAAREGVPITRDLIRTRKQEIVASEFGEVLEILEPDFGFEAVGGMEHIKRFFLEDVVRPIREGRFGAVPMGIALFGPPGTGKTVLAKALAKETGFNCVALNLGKILSMWVGSSERNLEKALACIDGLTPCVVFVDEIDQAGVGRGPSGDSGVSNRLFKRLLEYMSDTRHRGRVVFLVASNRPDLVDAALKRPGRLDVKIPVLPPEAPERAEILKALGRKVARWEVPEDLAREVAASTEGWTGAELEALVVKARQVAFRAGREVPDESDLRYALSVVSPSTRDLEYQSLLAIRECNDRELLPLRYRDRLADRRSLEEELERLKPVRRGPREV